MTFSTEQFLDKRGLPSSRKLSQPGISGVLEQLTPWLEGVTLAERLYALHHNLSDYPRKCGCGTPLTTWRSWSDGYIGKYCSQACESDARAKNRRVPQPKMYLSKSEKLQRQEQSNLAKYGVRWPWMLDTNKKQKAERAGVKLASAWIAELAAAGYIASFLPEEYTGNRQWLAVAHQRCGTEFKLQRMRWVGDKQMCPTCWSPRASKGQHNLAEWIKSLGVKVRVNDRKVFRGKMEIDIFIPDHNLAIEYDGLYWHSERGRPDIKQKSWEKFEALSKQGIRHLMIFDDEWETKQEIVKSRVKNALGLIDSRCAARKCEVRRLGAGEQHAFFASNHTQGGVRAKEAYGLFHGNLLVAAMSFGASRFGSQTQWELLRFSTLAGWSVTGGAGRLFAAWKNEHEGETIISFSDNRWGTGGFYRHLGFREDGQTGQGYFYTNSNGIRRSRQQFMKHKLAAQLAAFDPSLTERDNCWNNGWYRVWDLGNTRWVID